MINTNLTANTSAAANVNNFKAKKNFLKEKLLNCEDI
jgi:hypothetical protein